MAKTRCGHNATHIMEREFEIGMISESLLCCIIKLINLSVDI